MKNGNIKPILVLTLICLFMAAALAVTNSFTEPVISTAAAQRATAMRSDMIPDAAGFEPLSLDGMPGTVSEAYRTTNGVGYIFIMTVAGYGGNMEIICGLNEDGTIISTRVLQQNETKGLGDRVAEEDFGGQFTGKDSSLQGISAITGATISSSAYIEAVRSAFETFAIVGGAVR